MRVYANADEYALVKQWHESGACGDAHEARMVQRLLLLYWGGQNDEQTIAMLTESMKEVRGIYTNFRARYNGREVSDNTLGEVLRRETDSEKLREAWEASKQVGQQVSEKLLALVRARNTAARRKGFDNYYQQSLTLSELSEEMVFSLFDELEALTREPYRKAKAELDARLSARFRLPVNALRPWHYFDPFFQAWPQLGEANLDSHLAGKDPAALALKVYDGIGLEVRDILARSDLYERPGKNQHAFCIDIDRAGDTRILCNVQRDLRWNGTMLHELGHAVYNKYIDPALPYLLRTPAHSLSTEAIALLMGRLTLAEAWLRDVAEMPAETVARLLPVLQHQECNRQILFARWVFVMAHFERALYADPEQDLNSLWWDLVERFQLLTRPERRHAPDWAAKYHTANSPAMYHNYLLGELNASQLRRALTMDCGGLLAHPQAGEWLRERVFARGAEADWNESLRRATGETLTPKYFVEEFIR
jgi:peptidyl-dipeptidase A